MLARLARWFSPSSAQVSAHLAYVQVVSQARLPVFYEAWHVEDSIDGRFDVIVLHICVLLERLEAFEDRQDVQFFMRDLIEVFFSDMDRSLREMGVSDTGVGIRIKKMVEAFYGRRKGYGETLEDEAALQETLRRNVYREKAVSADGLRALASYVARNRASLARMDADALLRGEIPFCA